MFHLQEMLKHAILMNKLLNMMKYAISYGKLLNFIMDQVIIFSTLNGCNFAYKLQIKMYSIDIDENYIFS